MGLNADARSAIHAGHNNNEVSSRARQLLEHSLLSELRAVVARALSGLEMFAGSQLTEMDLLGSEVLQGSENVNSLVKGVRTSSGFLRSSK